MGYKMGEVKNSITEIIQAVQEYHHVLFIESWVTSELTRTVISTGSDWEVCGMLGGFLENGNFRKATAVTFFHNLSKLRSSFSVSVEEIMKAEATMRTSGLIPVALFHSHRSGSARPSDRDTRLPWVTGLPSLILAERDGMIIMFCYDEIGGMLMELRVINGNRETPDADQ
jgi:proteasome lid subunit RPN8/RPN11